MDGLLSPVGLGTPGAQHPGDTPRGMDGLLSPVRPGWWGGGAPNTNTNFALPPTSPRLLPFTLYNTGTDICFSKDILHGLFPQKLSWCRKTKATFNR